ncbi:MAG TPA: lysophospholipase [Verrucomicrobiae bacterium]|jgi:lysophospholipase|nr:lysophospholipase [Verrucomicrobiae bacterium]
MEEQDFFQAQDGTKLFYRYYANPDAKRTMIIVHGHGEHCGRYHKFVRHLETQKISLAMYDARGMGRSGGREVYIDSLDRFVDDLTAFRDFLRKRHGVNGKIILFGHSLGGLVAVHWAKRFPEEIACLILSSPCLGLKLSSFLIAFNAMLNRIHPRLVYANPVYPPHLSHNPEEIEAYKKDPLIKRKISVRLLAEMITYGRKIDAEPAFDFPFPVYILMSGLEKVVDREKTKAFFDKVKSPHKEMQIFEGFYHEIFNELGQEKVFEVLRQFLNASESFSRLD